MSEGYIFPETNSGFFMTSDTLFHEAFTGKSSIFPIDFWSGGKSGSVNFYPFYRCFLRRSL